METTGKMLANNSSSEENEAMEKAAVPTLRMPETSRTLQHPPPPSAKPQVEAVWED